MTKKRRRQTAFLLVVIVLFCTSCGNSRRQIPKLLEPEEVMSACRPVERGNVGDIQFLLATVVPMEYCSCFPSQITVDRIYVSVGDKVKKGDVLATADMSAANSQLLDLKRQLSQEQEIYALNCKVAELTEEDLKKRIKKAAQRENDAAKKANEEPGEETEEETEEETDEPEESEKDLRTQLAEHQENARYDAQLHDYRMQKLNAAIKEQQAVVKDGTLKAGHDGIVSNIKDLGVSHTALAGENIVVCYSDKKTYLEVHDVTVDTYKYQDYQKKYIMVDGKEVKAQEISYSTQEMILAKISSRYPNLRFVCPQEAGLKPGDSCPIYFVKESAENVLLAGNDSLHEDGSTAYVYVKDGDTKVRREVTTGLSDQYYTEIKEGLSEGEMVYYESSEKLPVDYEPYTVSTGNYSSKNYALSYQKSTLDTMLYRSEYDGSILKLAVKEKSRVKKGDLLYVVATGSGAAAIAEAKNAVEQENLSYQKTIKELGQQEEDLKKDSIQFKILSCQKQIAKIQHENAMVRLQEQYMEVSKNNDGTGNISVYAKESGTVSKLFLNEEDKLLAGDEVLSITTGTSELLMLQLVEPPRGNAVSVKRDKIASLETEVEYDDGGQKGRCVGYGVWENNSSKAYLYSDKNGAHLSYHGESGLEYATFYVRMEDKDFVKDLPSGGYFIFDEYSLHDVIVLPSSMVKKETDAIDTEKTWYYVWRVADGELVKQYVLVDEELMGTQQTVVLSGLHEGDILAEE